MTNVVNFSINPHHSLPKLTLFIHYTLFCCICNAAEPNRGILNPPSSIDEHNFSAILFRPHRKMHPNRPIPITLNQQLIKLLLRFIRIIKENDSIAKRLLHPCDLNIHRTSCKMIRVSRPTNLPIQLRRPIPRVNAYRFISHPIPLIIPLAQFFQPPTQSLQISNRLMAWDVIHFGMTPALCKLPEHKVLREFCITIQLNDFFHIFTFYLFTFPTRYGGTAVRR